MCRSPEYIRIHSPFGVTHLLVPTKTKALHSIIPKFNLLYFDFFYFEWFSSGIESSPKLFEMCGRPEVFGIHGSPEAYGNHDRLRCFCLMVPRLVAKGFLTHVCPGVLHPCIHICFDSCFTIVMFLRTICLILGSSCGYCGMFFRDVWGGVYVQCSIFYSIPYKSHSLFYFHISLKFNMCI